MNASKTSMMGARPRTWFLFALSSLGLAALVSSAASCAESNDPQAPQSDAATIPETDGAAGNGDGATDASADADCSDASDGGCTTHALTCAEADFCSVATNTDARFALLSVWGSSANDVWTVGSGGTIAHWDGTAWAKIPFDRKETLRAVTGSSATDVWVVSAPNLIVHSDGFAGNATKLELQAGRDADDPTNWLGSILTYAWSVGPNDFFVGGPTKQTWPLGSLWRHHPTTLPDTAPPSNWEIASTYCPEGAACAPSNGMWGTSASDLWVISDRGRAYHSTGPVGDGGGTEQWTLMKNTLTAADLNGIWGSGQSDIWMVGDGGTIRHWSNTPAQVWEVVASPTPENLRSVWGTGPNDAWAVGDTGTIIHWDGKAWSVATATLPVGPKPRLYSVWGSGPNDVWIVGEAVALHYTGPKASKGEVQ